MSRMGDWMIESEERGSAVFDEEQRMYKIENNTPLPRRLREREPLGDVPLDRMQIGQSFKIVVDSETAAKRKSAALRTRISRFRKTNPDKHFSVVRFAPRDNDNGDEVQEHMVRCYRVEGPVRMDRHGTDE